MTLRKLNGISVLIIALTFTVAAHAQNITGTWAIQDLGTANKVQLSMNVVSQNGKGNFNNSSGFDLSQLRGLNSGQMMTPVGAMVRFDIVREAGTFAAEGYFKSGNGAGTFVFQPNPGYIPQMRSLGFQDIDESRLLTMAMHDVGPSFATEIRANGILVSRTSELMSMKIHGVTTDFIRSMQQVGFRPEQGDLVKMRIHGVTPEFTNDVKRMYPSASIEDLVKMRIHGVAMDFANDVRQIYPAASLDDLVKLRIHGINTEYIRNAQSRGGNISLDQVVRMRIRGTN